MHQRLIPLSRCPLKPHYQCHQQFVHLKLDYLALHFNQLFHLLDQGPPRYLLKVVCLHFIVLRQVSLKMDPLLLKPLVAKPHQGKEFTQRSNNLFCIAQGYECHRLCSFFSILLSICQISLWQQRPLRRG